MTFANAYGETLTKYLVRRASMIYHKVRTRGALQVRWDPHGRRGHPSLVTYPFPTPAKHGHGVRGQFIAAYTPDVRINWIRRDLLDFAASLGETTIAQQD